MTWAAALGIGFCFGWLLEKAGLARYERVVNVFRFRDFTVLKFLLSALVVGALGNRALLALDLTASLPVPATFLGGNLAGGMVFGIGMALSGFCPGTIAAGIGEGRLDYLIPGSLGLLAGALGFGALYPRLFRSLAGSVHLAATIPEWLGVEPWLVVLLLAELAAILCYLIERRSARTRS
jgi:uncharacterized membrane protein YedE/YeeE